MFWKATLTQAYCMLRHKESLLAFYILLLMVLGNFISNVLTFQGLDIIQMYHPMKLLLLSYNRVNYNADATLLLIQLYPLLVVLPAGFALCKEQRSGQEVFMIARLGQFTYKFSKLAAAFLVTMVVFTVPFLMELLLNCIAFPLAATGDLTNMDIYEPSYIQDVRNYLMSGLYIDSPYLYTVVGTLLFGIVSSILACFTVAFSSIVRVKYRVILFLPVFVLLYATMYLPRGISTMKWYDYLLLFHDEPKSALFLIAGLSILILFSLFSTLWSSRKERF
ncbi:MAG: hypothetical protein LBQ15_03410 [Clostridium sp.]|jgi:hypothetical protein|nr:hypothetical protein [Clostridium sp.]